MSVGWVGGVRWHGQAALRAVGVYDNVRGRTELAADEDGDEAGQGHDEGAEEVLEQLTLRGQHVHTVEQRLLQQGRGGEELQGRTGRGG